MKVTSAEDSAFQLFSDVHNTCIAYQGFLKSKGINIDSINNSSQFKKLPIMDKKNYINKYPLTNRLYGGKRIEDYYMLCSSSGSTGEPTIWPRDFQTDLALEEKKEELYEEHFGISKKRTLCIITLALGVWTGGMLSVKLSWASAKKNKFTVITPGISKESTYRLIDRLYDDYDQVIILGYPPFLMDLIEYCSLHAQDLKKYNIKLMCTGEGFSEKWRDSMVSALSKDENRNDVVGFYACSDTGIIGAETKFTIKLLNYARNNRALCNDLFKSSELPSLFSYNPYAKYLEAVNGEILITARQPVPLIRYNIHDRGGVISKEELIKICQKHGVFYSSDDLNNNYVYIYGRSDSVQITANIYVEDIKYCIEHSKYKDRFTGYFHFGREELSNMRYRLKVILYLNKGMTLNTGEVVEFNREFYSNLLDANDDFRAIQQGTTIENFNIIFKDESEDENKYKNIKLKYFL